MVRLQAARAEPRNGSDECLLHDFSKLTPTSTTVATRLKGRAFDTFQSLTGLVVSRKYLRVGEEKARGRQPAPAGGSASATSRGRSRSACVVNGRLRHTGAGAVRHAAPCAVSRVGFYALQTSSGRAWHGEPFRSGSIGWRRCRRGSRVADSA